MATDLNEVATFIRVIDAGSMHGAARALGVPRSTVSRRVARLEELLGVRLLERTTRRMSLTEEGQRFYEKVAPALEVIEGASSEARDSGSEPSGTLRITAPIDFGHAVLGDVIARFVRRYPGVHVEVDLSNRLVDLVQEGFDLAVRAGSLADSSLVARRLGAVDVWLFATPGYLEARGAPSSPEDLVAHDCVLFHPQRGGSRWRLTRGDEAINVDVTGPVGSGDFSFVHQVVRAGAGIGPLPAFVPARDVEEGRLMRVLAPWALRGSSIYVVTPSGRHQPAKVKAFRDFLTEAMSPPPWEAVASRDTMPLRAKDTKTPRYQGTKDRS